MRRLQDAVRHDVTAAQDGGGRLGRVEEFEAVRKTGGVGVAAPAGESAGVERPRASERGGEEAGALAPGGGV